MFLLKASTTNVRNSCFWSDDSKYLRERSYLKAVNNTTVTSLYNIKTLQSGKGVFSHVTAPWSPTWQSCYSWKIMFSNMSALNSGIKLCSKTLATWTEKLGFILVEFGWFKLSNRICGSYRKRPYFSCVRYLLYQVNCVKLVCLTIKTEQETLKFSPQIVWVLSPVGKVTAVDIWEAYDLIKGWITTDADIP